jgi:hypothetical protein
LCDCGTERYFAQSNLKGGKSKSCGCLQKERASTTSFKHAMTEHSMYNTWSGMKDRCLNPKSDNWKDYGGRGIKVSKKWMHFEGFIEDMAATWRKGLTLDRKDVNGNYEKDNCRWATQAEQSRNTRRAVMIDTPWGKMNMCDAADRAGINRQTLRKRVLRGWSIERIFDEAESDLFGKKEPTI